LNAGRRDIQAKFGNVSHRDQQPAAVGLHGKEVEAAELGGVAPVGLGQPHPDVVGIAVQVFIGGGIQAAHQGTEGIHHLRRGHPDVHRPSPIHEQAHFGLLLVEARRDIHHPRGFGHQFLELLRNGIQQFQIVALEVHIDGSSGLEAVRNENARDNARNPGDPLPGHGLQLFLRVPPLVLFLQLDVNAPFPHRSGRAGAHGGVGQVEAGEAVEHLQDGLQPPAAFFQAGIRRGREIDLEFGTVIGGEEGAAEIGGQVEGANKACETRREDGLAVLQGPADEMLVTLGEPLEEAVEAHQQPEDQPASLPRSTVLTFHVGVHPAGGEHRVEGEGNQQRNQDGEGHRNAELVEEPANNPLHERHGHKHRHDGEGRRHDRQADFGRTFERSPPVVLALLQMADDVLPHHDGVVDEEADGQRKAHQGHDIEREAQRHDDDERADDADGQGEAGDDGGAP